MPTRADVRRTIERQRDALIDLDSAVDDARRDVDAAVERLRVQVSERDRGAVHLQHLIELAEADRD
jgi:hypothetical protein